MFKALESLIIDKIIDPKLVEVHFYCERVRWLDDLIEKYHLKNIVNVYERITHEKSLMVQAESQLLLIILLLNNCYEKGVLTAKLFEYLVSGRPILCIGPRDGAAARIINETNTGITCDNDACLMNVLRNYYFNYIENGYVKLIPDISKIQKYDFSEMAGRFCSIFDEQLSNYK